MINPQLFFNFLHNKNINFFTGVPDSLLKSICAYITDNSLNNNHIIAANEGNAISLGIGHYLATNNLPLIYMQNSGLGNAINPLLSLADQEVYAIPMLLMIGWRGEPNIQDEPQHKKQGRITIELLKSMEIPFFVLSPDTSNEESKLITQEAVNIAQSNNSPCALLVRKGSFNNYTLKNDVTGNHTLYREQAMKLVVDCLDDKDIIVATTGGISRELFEYREKLGQGHEKDFLTVGGMGHANQIALGIALQKPDRQVFCFDGDGAMLMHMGSLAINANVGCNNLKHIIFNNGSHESVGGQPTVAYKIDIKAIAKAVGYVKTCRANNVLSLKKSIKELKQFNGIGLLEIQLKRGYRGDLGRPTTSPFENKKALMKFIK
jgi:phosphonopyruvate decarboxylase